MQRWVGIDEAGYGPNLGPLVMTAVVAEALQDTEDRPDPPDLWGDLRGKVCRAGGDGKLLWIDDSKAVYSGGVGRDRLESACALAIEATGTPTPHCAATLLNALQAGDLSRTELGRWLPKGEAPPVWPGGESAERITRLRSLKPLSPHSQTWRIAEVRTVALGPERFNESLGRHGSKAKVHFEAFASLLHPIWGLMKEGDRTSLCSDKHGGRHFYLEPLSDVFPGSWIDRGPEGRELSRYTVRRESRSMVLSFMPRADAENGLVALASLISKAVRETWMDCFNRFWRDRIPGLKPTAGYPQDAARYRRQIEGLALEMGLDPRSWWREK